MALDQPQYVQEYPPGVVLWIVANQKYFNSSNGQDTSYEGREGAEVDEANIREALQPFKVDLRVWNDLTLYGKEGILIRLKEIYEEVESEPNKFSGLVFLGMSHGEQVDGKDYFVTSDYNFHIGCFPLYDFRKQYHTSLHHSTRQT